MQGRGERIALPVSQSAEPRSGTQRGGVALLALSRAAARALSARCVSRVDGNPIFVLSIGETVRLLCGVAEFLTADVSVVDVPVVDVPDMLEESVVVVVVLAFGVVVVSLLLELGGVVVVAELSVCWLCVGVGAGAPVPSCVESVLGVAVVEGVVVVLVLVDEFIEDESVVVEDGGVVVVEDEGAVDPIEESVVVVDDGGVVVVVDEDDGVDIDEESVVVDEDGVVVVVDGDVVTSPVDVACEPSFETRM
jgi:hypothetical protein